MFRVLGTGRCFLETRGGLRFRARYGYIASNSLIGRKAGFCSTEFKNSYVAIRRIAMDQVVEVVETEVVELSLAELAQVGGGSGIDSLG
jgi:hypothetical protein